MTRILTATLLILAVAAILFFGPLWSLTLAAALVAALAAHEFRALAKRIRIDIPLPWLLVSIAAIFFVTLHLTDAELPILSLLALTLFAWSGFRSPLECVLPNTAAGLFALLYIAYPLTLIPLIKAHGDAGDGDGTGLLVFLFVCVWSGDIAALYLGRAFGKRKLAPRLSPGKTWEGALASIAGSILCGLGVFYLGQYLATAKGITVLHLAMPAWQVVLLAALLNVAAQLGDLLESALKRGANVKDSGTLLPGHGGILDRIDALLFAAPVLWYVLLLRDWQTLFH